MAKGLAIAFLITLVGGHLADRQGDAFGRPLSLFRDVEPAWIGYVMFALLIAIAVEVSRTARRLGNRNQTAVYAFVTCSLTVTALTPSYAPLHLLGAELSLFVLFANYAWLLDQNDMPYWLTAHLSIVLFLVLADAIASTGLWKKVLDLYLMAAVMIHHHAMEKSLATEGNTRRLAESRPTAEVS